MHTETEQYHESFLETYVCTIAATLKKIDVFVKTAEGELEINDVAYILSMNPSDIRRIMRKKKLSCIDKRNFFTIMEQGNSEICMFYKRELECGSPYVYTRENISYIYDLELEAVNKACDELHLKEITAYTLPALFSNILV